MKISVTELKKIVKEEAARLVEKKKGLPATKAPAPIAKPEGDQDPDGADELEHPVDWVKVLKLRESSLKRRLRAVQQRLAHHENEG